LTLLDLLDREGQLTATRASELTGENTANCSFHLRQLAKRGFIEPADPADARERPWRRSTAGVRIPATTDPRLLAASATVGALVVERAAADAVQFLGEREHDEVGWQEASLVTIETLHLSRDELEELSREIAAVIERRESARSKRGGGTRPVRVAAMSFPLSQ
jgi:hypothetical protein